MASSRDRTPANTTGTESFLPGRPPSWLRPSIRTQPDFHSLDCSLDILFMTIQQLRRHPLHTEPMPDLTHFHDHRAYNILYQLRRDMVLMDRIVHSIYQARRLLQFVPESLDVQGNTASTPQRNSPPATLPHFTIHHPVSLCHLPTPTTHLHLLHHHARPLKMRSAFTITGLAPHHVTRLTPARPMTTESESAHAHVTPAGTNSPTSPQQHA